jgi:hypothetical protein
MSSPTDTAAPTTADLKRANTEESTLPPPEQKHHADVEEDEADEESRFELDLHDLNQLYTLVSADDSTFIDDRVVFVRLPVQRLLSSSPTTLTTDKKVEAALKIQIPTDYPRSPPRLELLVSLLLYLANVIIMKLSCFKF